MAQTHAKKEKNSKKIGIIFLCLFVTTAVIFGSMFAFFSDVISGDTQIVIGTLDLKANSADAEFWKNETKLDGSDDEHALIQLENFNPGDRIVVKVPVINEGSKSAWLRGAVKLTGTAFGVLDDDSESKFADYFTVYKGNVSRADIIADNTAATDAEMTLTVEDGVGATWTDTGADLAVINGNPAKAAPEIENAASVLLNGGTADTAIYSATGGFVEYTIYFKGAGSKNEWQDKTIKFDYKAEAVQFRNNPLSGTTWADLTATSFDLVP